MNVYIDVLIKIGAAVLCGGIIGLEREHHNQPAGLRTHIILCVGATLVTIVSVSFAKNIGSQPYADPARVAASIVTGIGFLGGGAILRMGSNVRGLTTAACIWTVAGIGMAIGIGEYFPAALASVVVLFALHFLRRVERIFLQRRKLKQMTLTARSSPDILGSVEKVLLAHRIFMKNIEVNRDASDPNVEINALVTIPERVNLNKLSDEIFQIPGTMHFEIE